MELCKGEGHLFLCKPELCPLILCENIFEIGSRKPRGDLDFILKFIWEDDVVIFNPVVFLPEYGMLDFGSGEMDFTVERKAGHRGYFLYGIVVEQYVSDFFHFRDFWRDVFQ